MEDTRTRTMALDDMMVTPGPGFPGGPFPPMHRVPVFSTMGRGPRGKQGEKGDKGEQGESVTFADPIEWDPNRSYEALTVVLHDGNSYTSQQFVPAGIAITDNVYWAETGNYNAQVEQYRQEVLRYAEVLEDNTIQKNIVADITKDNQEIFANDTDISATQGNTTHVNVVTVNEDLSLESAIAAGMCATLNVNGNNDICETVSLVGSYLRHASEFFYGNAYTGTTYAGTYDNPTLIDPKQHLVDGKMPIDCATFTTLIGGGCTFDNSIYASNATINRLYHAMYDLAGGSVKPYWKYNPRHETFENPNVGYGRVLSDAMAKMFFDAGVLSAIDNKTESLQIGDIVFSGNTESRFMKITHCSIIAGGIDFTTTGAIIAESVSSTESAIVTRKLSDANIAGSLRAKISPNYNAGVRLHSSYAPYTLPIYNRDLNANPVTWNADTGLGDVLAKVIAITSNTSNRRNIHIVASNGLSTIEKDVSFLGTRLIFLPYGWSITITSSETDTFNIMQQRCGTDKAIIVLPRTVS